MCVNLCEKLRTMAVNFYLDKRTDKKGDSPIRVSVSINGIRFLSSSGYKIAPDKWDTRKQQVKKGAASANGLTYMTINTILSKIKDFFTDYENEAVRQMRKVSVEDIKKAFSTHFGGVRKSAQPERTTDAPLISDLISDFIKKESVQKQWTVSTTKKFHTIRQHLIKMNASLSLSNVNKDLPTSFAAYLMGVGMGNVTTAKYIKLLKWFLRWLSGQGYEISQDCLSAEINIKTAHKKIIFLKWEELMGLLHYEIPPTGTIVPLTSPSGKPYTKIVLTRSGYVKARDIFAFCCFTGLRYSDAANLKWSNIEKDTISITTIKTTDSLVIQLNKYSKEILDKYRSVQEDGGFIFPHITNQKMNMYLKDICELCGINEPITQTYFYGTERVEKTMPKYALIGTHAGRRTFVCNALMLGIPAEIVMKWTGHSDYSAMKPYIDMTNEAKEKEMAKFDKL